MIDSTSRPKAEPPPLRCQTSRDSGFSLIIVSILITVAAILLVAMLPGGGAGDYNQKTISNVKKLEKVEEAMRSFMAFNGRRPCPADGQYNTSSKYFGVEAAGPGNCQSGTPAAPMGPDKGTNEIVAGTIPVRSLGLPEDYAFDSYGRPFTYVVDKRATDSAASARGTGRVPGCYNLMQNIKYNTGVTSALVIKDSTNGNFLDHTMYAYISHGPSGYGAFPPQGSTVANRINSGSTDADMQTNAGVNSNFIYNTAQFTNVRVKKDRVLPSRNDTGFDDLLWYRDDIKNTCCLGASCIQGMIANGSAAFEQSGYSLATGDVNGDGIPDLIIGAPLASPGGRFRAGTVFVVFGTKFGFPDPLPLGSLNGANGFELDGATSNYEAGSSVATGDVNGDGTSDIIIGAPWSPSTSAPTGAAYVIFGGKGGANSGTGVAWSSCPCTLNPAFFNGTNGVEFDGAIAPDEVGRSVATGDVNGDGIQDILLGATNAAPEGIFDAGSVYVVYGRKAGWHGTPTTLNAAFLDGSNGVELDGSQPSFTGSSVATGDVNGDGISDIIIGAYCGGASCSGAAYVVFGGPAPLLQEIATIATSTTATVASTSGLSVNQTIHSPTAGCFSASGATITNITGNAITFSPAAGCFGNFQMNVTSTPLNSSFLNGSNGAEFDGTAPDEFLGWSVATGDVNGDGIADIVVGAPGTAPNGQQSGSVYVLFGRKAGWSGTVTSLRSAFLNGTNGVEFDGTAANGWAGASVAAGDVNGDGTSDIIIGAPALNTSVSHAFVVFGSKAGWPGSPIVLNSSFLNGTNGVEFDGAAANGWAGYSVAVGDVSGDGIPDLIVGAPYVSPEGVTFAGSTYVYFGRKKGWPTSPYNLGGL